MKNVTRRLITGEGSVDFNQVLATYQKDGWTLCPESLCVTVIQSEYPVRIYTFSAIVEAATQP